MKQDFLAKSFSLPTLFTVEDIILLFISYLMIIEYICINTRREITPLARYGTPFVLVAFRLETKQNDQLLTEESGYPILKIIIFIHADVNTKLYLQ